MQLVRILALFGTLVLATRIEQSSGDDASLNCLDGTGFCERTREWKIDQSLNSPSDLSYSADIDALKITPSEGKIEV